MISNDHFLYLNFDTHYYFKMTTKTQKKQRSIQEYRRDIFALKGKLKSQQEYLQQLKQKYADKDVFSEKSYTYSMKLKILEYSLNDIRAKINKYHEEDAYEYYLLNFSAFALVKSCEIIGMTKEMIFRGVDKDYKGEVGWFDLSNFLKEVMRYSILILGLDSQFINPILKAIQPDESKPISKQRYDQFLSSFMLKTQQNGEQIDNLDGAALRIAREMIKQSIKPSDLWTQKQVNIATATYSLMTKVKFLDVLDCIGCYCKCDPLKTGTVSTNAIVTLLKQRMNDADNFQKGAPIKLSRS